MYYLVICLLWVVIMALLNLPKGHGPVMEIIRIPNQIILSQSHYHMYIIFGSLKGRGGEGNESK